MAKITHRFNEMHMIEITPYFNLRHLLWFTPVDFFSYFYLLILFMLTVPDCGKIHLLRCICRFYYWVEDIQKHCLHVHLMLPKSKLQDAKQCLWNP